MIPKNLEKLMAGFLKETPRCMVCEEYIYQGQKAHVFFMIGKSFCEDPDPATQLMAVHNGCYYNATKLEQQLLEEGDV